MEYLLFALAGYCFGSVLFSMLLARLCCGVDLLTQSPDANPGAANAFTLAGPCVGIAGAVLDVLKGAVPVYLAAARLDTAHPLFALVLAAPVLGHAWPVFSHFHGGKAIAVSFGVLLGLVPNWRPVLLLAFYYLLFSLVIIIDPHLFRSVAAFSLFALTAALRFGLCPVTAGCVLVALTVVQKHVSQYHGEQPAVRLGVWRAFAHRWF